MLFYKRERCVQLFDKHRRQDERHSESHRIGYEQKHALDSRSGGTRQSQSRAEKGTDTGSKAYRIDDAEKKKKNDKVWESITDIFPKICVIGVALLWCYIFYVIMFVEKVTEGVDLGEIIYAGVIYIYFSLICAWFCSRVLIYVGLVVIAIIEMLVEAIMGIVNDEKLKQISAERDRIQHSIDEKTEELAAVQSELSSLEQRIQRIEENRETTINKLSQVSPRRMEEAWRRQSLG